METTVISMEITSINKGMMIWNNCGFHGKCAHSYLSLSVFEHEVVKMCYLWVLNSVKSSYNYYCSKQGVSQLFLFYFIFVKLHTGFQITKCTFKDIIIVTRTMRFYRCTHFALLHIALWEHCTSFPSPFFKNNVMMTFQIFCWRCSLLTNTNVCVTARRASRLKLIWNTITSLVIQLVSLFSPSPGKAVPSRVCST